jgi:microcystin-dependent protein
MFCAGQLLPISENETLFQLIGTTYGGDGQSTFALPNLQSRVPIHQGTFQGNTFVIGQSAGVETVTLTTQQIPSHNHALSATSTGQQQAPSGTALPAVVTAASVNNPHLYGPVGSLPTTLNSASIANSGGSQPHDNLQPYLVVNFIISMFGIFPSQN